MVDGRNGCGVPVGGGSEAFSVLKTRGTPCGSGNLVVVKKDLTQCKQEEEEEEEDCSESLSAALCTLSLSRGQQQNRMSVLNVCGEKLVAVPLD
jgi:hypothetical protein